MTQLLLASSRKEAPSASKVVASIVPDSSVAPSKSVARFESVASFRSLASVSRFAWPLGVLLGTLLFRTAEVHAQSTVDEKMKAAIERGVKVLERGARIYPMNRQCFSCHHQTLPLLGTLAAEGAGVATDGELRKSIVEFTRKSFERRRDKLLSGRAVEGAGLTVGYGLWTLELASSEPDELTDAMVHNLIEQQEHDGHWGPEAIRPPMEESRVICTVLAASGLKRFARGAQLEKSRAAIDRAKRWLDTAPLVAHEDHVARLWGLVRLEGDAEAIAAARRKLFDRQRDDGGWSQTESMASDAYSTATTLWVLQRAGLERGSASRVRAAQWLLKNQLVDGSWLVVTRATPVQAYFDNGDPHGKSQFLSLAATGWSVAALSEEVAP